MGKIMGPHDIYIGSLFDLLNLRFAPNEFPGMAASDGVGEMVALQREFKIFAPDRSFRDSAAILNLAGTRNTATKNLWYTLLDDLKTYESNVAGRNGNEAIVHAIIENLESPDCSPVHFKAHDSRLDRRVLVTRDAAPLFYLVHGKGDFLTVSLPMKPRRTAKRPARPKPAP